MKSTNKAANRTDKHVGARVRMRRMMLGLSQEKLGDALGLTFQQVQKYEKGTNRIGASRLQQLSDILKVPVAFFFEGLPTNNMATDTGVQSLQQHLATTDGLALTKAFAAITDSNIRKKIVDLVEQIATAITR